MVTLVIHHPSAFASYLIALYIHFYYQTEGGIDTIVIANELSNSDQTRMDIPWCGVNTLSNLHVKHLDYLHHFVFNFLMLHQKMIPPAAVNISQRTLSGVPHISAQITGNSVVGILYHPSVILGSLKILAFQTSNITQASSWKPTSFEELVRQIRRRKLSEKVIFLNYNSPFKSDRNRLATGYSMRESTNTIGYEHNSYSGMPNSVLWVPQFKSKLLEAYGELGLQWHISGEQNTVKIRIFPHSLNEVQHEVMLDLDVFYGLKAGDLTILILENEVGEIKARSRL